MTARIVELAAHSRKQRTRRSLNGHVRSRKTPTYPVLDVELDAHAIQRQRASEIPAHAEGRLRVFVGPDDSWEVKVARAGDRHSLLLRGTADASAPATFREILCWLFGVPA